MDLKDLIALRTRYLCQLYGRSDTLAGIDDPDRRRIARLSVAYDAEHRDLYETYLIRSYGRADTLEEIDNDKRRAAAERAIKRTREASAEEAKKYLEGS